jgi:hypothetical protein
MDDVVKRAMGGQVGVVFAFGQTGSGKSHTMNGLMDRLALELFVDDASSEASMSTRNMTLAYMEILGPNVRDCLLPTTTETENGDARSRV